jgi:hypothetical protein
VRTTGTGRGQSSAPTTTVALLSDSGATSSFSFASSANFIMWFLSATGSPEETMSLPSGPKIARRAAVSPDAAAWTSASTACCSVSNARARAGSAARSARVGRKANARAAPTRNGIARRDRIERFFMSAPPPYRRPPPRPPPPRDMPPPREPMLEEPRELDDRAELPL